MLIYLLALETTLTWLSLIQISLVIFGALYQYIQCCLSLEGSLKEEEGSVTLAGRHSSKEGLAENISTVSTRVFRKNNAPTVASFLSQSRESSSLRTLRKAMLGKLRLEQKHWWCCRDPA